MPPRPREPRYLLCTGQLVPYKAIHEYFVSHIVGIVVTIYRKGQPMTVLKRFSQSLRTDRVPPLNPEIDSICVGEVNAMRCRYEGCTNSTHWAISKSAEKVLIASHTSTDEYLLRKGG